MILHQDITEFRHIRRGLWWIKESVQNHIYTSESARIIVCGQCRFLPLHKKKTTSLASSTVSSVTGEWSESPGQWLEVTRVSFSCWMELVSLVPSQSKQASPRSTWNFEGWVMVIYIRNRSWSVCLYLLQDLKRIAIWLMIIVLLLASFSNPLGLDLETVWPPLELRLWK